MENAQFVSVFLTGLLSGGITCMAVQGGVLTTMISQQNSERNNLNLNINRSLIIFLVTKIIIYSLLGFMLGWFGSLFQMSIQFQIVLLSVIGLYMVATAVSMLFPHPIFRFILLQPHHGIMKRVTKAHANYAFLRPALFGVSTVFFPCGTTQAIMALSIASGNPFAGALILGLFTLGTTPLFFLLGYATIMLRKTLRETFVKLSAILVIGFALLTINSALSLSGTKYTLDAFLYDGWCLISYCGGSITNLQMNQNQTITILDSGYTPNIFAVRAGEPVHLLLKNNGGNGCTQAFTIPQLGIQKIVPIHQQATLDFVAPHEKGALYFMCSQGLYRGTIQVM